MGRTFREKSCFALNGSFSKWSEQNWTINNRPLGRAAKGENPLLCATKKERIFVRSFFVCVTDLEEDLRVGRTFREKSCFTSNEKLLLAYSRQRTSLIMANYL